MTIKSLTLPPPELIDGEPCTERSGDTQSQPSRLLFEKVAAIVGIMFICGGKVLLEPKRRKVGEAPRFSTRR